MYKIHLQTNISHIIYTDLITTLSYSAQFYYTVRHNYQTP